MLIMKERNLTDDQKRRIEAIKKEWLDELKKIPEPVLSHWPDDSINEPYRKLERKYKPLLDAIMEENND